MKAGVTGTQNGWTKAQRMMFTLIIAELDITEWHHGDCIGVDAQATMVVRQRFGMDIVHCHPPEDPKKRAYVSGHVIYSTKPYKERNVDIATAVEILFVIPRTHTAKEAPRSGTWYTYRQAKALERRIIGIGPRGERFE